jgi:hypothetical protein
MAIVASTDANKMTAALHTNGRAGGRRRVFTGGNFSVRRIAPIRTPVQAKIIQFVFICSGIRVAMRSLAGKMQNFFRRVEMP